ncbi:hypothetical protein ACIHFD_41770 [Nonomuraea sp. NPDC051941]|uniref:hypothetical protein n=1 Tax=Nonomuraea sp. NPDC051941 TaxID=3364373 RepID=UPI0037C95549
MMAQDLAPEAPATAAGMVLGGSVAVAGVLYVAPGWLQALVGLGTGMLIGFTLVIPAALIVLVMLRRHPGARRTYMYPLGVAEHARTLGLNAEPRIASVPGEVVDVAEETEASLIALGSLGR